MKGQMEIKRKKKKQKRKQTTTVTALTATQNGDGIMGIATQRIYSLTSRGNGISEMRPNDRFNYPEKNKMSGFSK